MATSDYAPPLGRVLDRPRMSSQFLDVAPRMPDAEGRWAGVGVKVEQFPFRPQVGKPADVCNHTDLAESPLECSADDWETFLPFIVGDAVKRSSMDEKVASETTDELLAALRTHGLSYFYAKELVAAAASGSQSLKSTAHAAAGIAFGSAATPIWNALPALESDLAGVTYGQAGVIHMPPGMLSQAVAECGLRMEGGNWVTPLGNVVIADTGYIGMAAPTGQSASGSGEDWLYASGPVRWAYAEQPSPFVTHDGGSFTLSTNKGTSVLYGQGVIVFEPATVSAVLASYTVS